MIFKQCVSLQNPVYALNPGNEVANFLMPSQVFLNSRAGDIVAMGARVGRYYADLS